uniref:glutathione S-transferase P n=1 Tax=Myxine glutinosa TaxID=7769 RepID=UPI00358FDC07
MSNFKITYFACRGRCTAIKMILSDQGMTWEDETFSSLSEWQTSETKKKAAFGQLPAFTDGDFTMYQSNAILRYLARKFDLYGSNDKDAALIDMLNDGVEDLRMKYLKMIYTNYEEGKADFVKSLSVELDYFEKLLGKNQDGKFCLVGKKISFADYNLFDLLNIIEVLQPGTLRPFALLFAFAARIASRPQISKFLGSDNHRKLPINGNGKQ